MTEPLVEDADLALYQGDALSILREIEPESVNCCVTSPPYYLLRDYEDESQIGLEDTLAEYVEALVAVFAEVRRVLRQDGVLWLNLADTHCSAKRVLGNGVRSPFVKPKDLYGVPFEVALALRNDGWWLRQTVIWDKANATPESAKDRPTSSHEYVFLLAKSRRYWFDAAAIAEPAAWERWGAQTSVKEVVGKAAIAKPRTKAEIGGKWSGIGGSSARAAATNGGGESEPIEAALTRNARSVWKLNTAQYPEAHFAVMPMALAERCVLAGCPVGGTVLDPFAGAGTTSLAARKHGRRSIAIELNPDFCTILARRLSQQSLLIGPA